MDSPKTILITGSTDGIGYATATGLASMGFQIVLHGRSEKKVKDGVQKLLSKNPNWNLGYVWGDLSNPNEIDSMVEAIKNQFPDISILINNAGVFMDHYMTDTRGYEMTFSVNHLAYFHLTLRLLDTLLKNPIARVINISSMAHGNKIYFDNLHFKKSYSGYEAYAQSKLANILFTYELDRKLKGKQIAVNCLHPGVVNTKLLRTGWGGMGSSLEKGAATSIYLASYKEGETISGRYFVNKKASTSSSESYNIETAARLWDVSEKMTGVKFQ